MKHLFTLLFILTANLLLSQVDSTAVGSPDSLEIDLTPPAPQRAKHLFLEFELGYGKSHYEIIGNKYPELVSCRGEHEKKIKVPTAELKVGYQIKNWWSVSAGFQYFQTGFDFSEEKMLSDTLPMEFVIGCEVYEVVDPQYGYVFAGFFDPRFASGIIGYHPAEATLSIKPRYHYLGFPVKTELSALLAVTRGHGWARLFVNGGVTPNYMVKQGYHQSYENESWSYVLEDSVGIPAPYLRRWNMSASVGVGLAFMIRKQCEVRIEMNRQDQLFCLFNWTHEYYQERHGISTLNISWRYYFRKQ